MPPVRQQFRSLGTLLMERGLLTHAQLDQALDEQKRTGEKLGRILTTRGWVREKDIMSALQGLMVVVFQLAGEDYGVETLAVREIIRAVEPRAVPAVPAWMPGIIDYRGKVVPVMDLGIRLGREVRRDDASRIIIYEDRGGRAWGLSVDSVSSVQQVGREELEGEGNHWAPKGVPTRWLSGLARLEGRPVALLNLDEVLAEGKAEAQAALEGLP
jgi:purine-binding chemotaxis protein CheW